jgi:hypothetical protein
MATKRQRRDRRSVDARVMPPARAAFYAATVAALAFSARAALVGPPPLRVAALVAAVYFSTLMVGVLVLRLRVFVDAVIAGPPGSRGVALTFDDGPDPKSTPRVLEVLAAAGVTATFFVIGRKAEQHPELVREMVARGHQVALHSYAHDRLFAMRGPAIWRRDLTRGLRVLESITGQRPSLFRPPVGHTNPHVAGVMHALGLTVVGWTVSARDGVRGSPRAVADRVLKYAKNGSIVLMHDASERGDFEPAGVAALRDIVAGLAARGLPVVSLNDWLQPLRDSGAATGAPSVTTKRAPPA